MQLAKGDRLMTIILPADYHARCALERVRVNCITPDAAARQDIRPLRIGILNVMPKAESYEFSLLHPLGRSILQVEPEWIRLETHSYSTSNRSHIRNLYVTFEQALERRPLDGLLLTGAPIEDIPYERVHYWHELVEILRFARRHIPSTLGFAGAAWHWRSSSTSRRLPCPTSCSECIRTSISV
ncbi:MAG: homoserine O-succinyltransferase [Polyangiaceae bacterium]